ncbi:PP2C family protein-serine/threonine phosphatase [Chloroflexota bacterium]
MSSGLEGLTDRMKSIYKLSSSRLSHPGRKRANNEDYVDAFEPVDAGTLEAFGSLFIVADGVGGASRGEKASQYAVKKVLHAYFVDPSGNPGARLVASIRSACGEIYDFSQRMAAGSQMATTLVAGLIHQNQLLVANVGDSRAYLIRKGRIDQLTRDHSFHGELIHEGLMTEEESLNMKGKNVITRSVGGESDVKVDLFNRIDLQTGDRIIFCSDGLTKYAVKEEILARSQDLPIDEVAGALVEFANRSGGADNISVIAVEVGDLVDVSTAAKGNAGKQKKPDSVDWDTMVTDHSRYRGTPQIRKQNKLLFPAVITSVILLIVMGSFVGFMAPGIRSIISITKTLTGSSQVTETTVLKPTSTMTATITSTVTQSPNPELKIEGMIVAEAGAYCREGLTEDSNILQGLIPHTVVEIEGIFTDADGKTWFKIKTQRVAGESCWVIEYDQFGVKLIEIKGERNDLPKITPLPPSTPVPSETPIPTSTLAPTISSSPSNES